MRFTVPYPPSANRYWRNWRGRMVASPVAKQYKSDVGKLVGSKVKFAGPVSITVEIHRPIRRGDLDNRLKVLLDALRGVVYEDDEQVARIIATRHESKTNPRAVVWVEKFEEPKGSA